MTKRKLLLILLMAAALIVMSAFVTGCDSQDDTSDTTGTTASGEGEQTVTTASPATSEENTTESTTSASPVTEPEPEEEWVSALFGGGPLVLGGIPTASIIKESGFNTVILWSVHVNSETADLYFNDTLICSNGEYVGTTMWKRGWETLKEGDNAIDRIEISIGAWGTQDFEAIRTLMKRDGDGEDTVLYKNFKKLIEVTGADAVNYDDESCYDVNATVAFSEMLLTMGVKISLCPYTNMSFWTSLYSRLGDSVDRIYLQCYSGGAGNNPAEWYSAFGTKVIPGYWCLHNGGSEGMSAEQVEETLKRASRFSEGAFIWYYDDTKNLSSPNSTADYAEAINSVGREYA